MMNSEFQEGAEGLREKAVPSPASAYAPIPDAWNRVTREIIRGAMEVHSVLGPGLLERLYEAALCHELSEARVAFERQLPLRMRYKSIELPEQRLDLCVERLVVVELKSVERVTDVDLAQLVSYQRAADIPLGLLLNFNTARLKDGIFRRVNPHATAIRALPRPRAASLSTSGPSVDSEFSA